MPDELRARLAEAKQALEAFRQGQVDAVLGEKAPVLVRQAQDALQRSEALFRAIFDRSLDAMLIADDAGRYVDVNPAACVLFGVTRDDLLGRTPGDFSEPDFPFDEAWQAFLDAGEARGRFEVVRPDGFRRVTDFAAVASIAPGRHLSILRDISDQLAADQRIHTLSQIVERTEDAVMLTDRQSQIIYVNPSFERMTGWPADEVVGKTPAILQSGEHDDAFYEELWGVLEEGAPFRATFVNRCRDGTLYREQKTIQAIRDPDGAITHYFSTGRDVTERDRLEEHLRGTQRLEAIGRLAGGVAHDFNNLLTVIRSYGSLALEAVDSQTQLFDDTMEIIRAAERAEKLTAQLLAFSRRQTVRPRNVGVNALLQDLERMLSRLITEDIELAVRLDEDAGAVLIDPGALEQVVVNLVVNAKDAIDDVGHLEVCTRAVTIDGTDSSPPGSPSEPGDYVLIIVSDTGCGMGEDARRQAFEPFYTTKEEGTGLGLSTCYGIVAQAGGHLWIDSELGKGTRISVWLPEVDTEPDLLEAVEHRASRGRGESVLVVEDNAPLQRVIKRVLSELGYQVTIAANGRSALEIHAEHGPFDLILTDVVMPHMNGRELTARLREEDADLLVLYMSGYTDNVIAQHGVLDPDVNFLPKPFTPKALSAAVRGVLDGVGADLL